MSSLQVDLPFPPSVNHYWGTRVTRPRTRAGARPKVTRFITEQGKVFRSDSIKACMAAGLMAGEPIDGSLSCKIFLSPPDKRRRDVDNYSKGILDALENAQVFYDDCQIKHLEIFMLNPSKPGGARVELAEIQGVSQ